MAEFSLTAPVAPVDFVAPDAGQQITAWSSMVGKTIRHVCDAPAGRSNESVAAVVIFEDDSWATLFAVSSGTCEDDGSSLELCRGLASQRPPLTDYLSPTQLLAAGMVNHGQFEYLVRQEQKLKQEADAALAARLRERADRLERGG